jgi:hypothetical protein
MPAMSRSADVPGPELTRRGSGSGGGRGGDGGSAALLAAAAIAASTSYVTVYTAGNALVITLGCALLAALAAWRLVPRVPAGWAVAAALLIGLIPQLWRPPIGNVHRGLLLPLAIGLGVAASVLLLLGVLGAVRRRRQLALLAFACAAAAQLLVVQASARPAIDVWVIFQQATRGLLHGLNPYRMLFTGVPAGQTNDCFNYLPFTLLASLPGRVLLGDVRYGEVAVLLVGAALLLWALHRRADDRVSGRLDQPEGVVPAAQPERRPGPPGSRRFRGRYAPVDEAERRCLSAVLAVMAVSLPGTLRVAQQAWNESVILGCLLAAVALLLLERAWWAVVPLGLALATKQHVALILPLWALHPRFGWRRAVVAGAIGATVCLPWLVADADRFYGCTVRFFIDLPARQDSLSVWKFVPGALRVPAVLALTVGAYLLAWRLLDGTVATVVFGSGLVFAAFDLANKQSFENQWVLACQLLVVGLASRAAEVSGGWRATIPGTGPQSRQSGVPGDPV